MKKIFRTSLLVLFIFTKMHGQLAFWFESFGNNCSRNMVAQGVVTTFTNGPWGTIVSYTPNGSQANWWYLSATESGMPVGSCGNGCIITPTLINRTLHVGFTKSFPDSGAVYARTINSATNKLCISPYINCSLYTNISMSFKYLSGGDGTNNYCETMFFDGLTWNSLGILASTGGSCIPKGIWSSQTYTLPNSANNNSNVRIGFRWQNDSTPGTDTISVAIDDINLIGYSTIGVIVNNNISNLSAFPNPVSDFLTLDFSAVANNEGFVRAQIINYIGQIEKEIDLSFIDKKARIDIKDLPPGNYCLNLKGNNTINVSKRFVVNR